MEGDVQLRSPRSNSKAFDERLCIICQGSDTVNLKSEAHGRTKIMEYADKKRDIVWERLKQIDNAPFKYHMDNTCYKFYTHKKSLKRLQVLNLINLYVKHLNILKLSYKL